QREGDDDGDGEPLGATEGADAEADLLPEGDGGVEPAGVPDAMHGVADFADVAEFLQRGAASGGGILAALDPVLDADREMAADLVVEVAIVRSHWSAPDA